jgi:hypothetical protein
MKMRILARSSADAPGSLASDNSRKCSISASVSGPSKEVYQLKKAMYITVMMSQVHLVAVMFFLLP